MKSIITLLAVIGFFISWSSTLIHPAYAQSQYNAHGIAIDFPTGYSPIEQSTDSGITTINIIFMFTDFGFGGGFETDPDGAVMSVQLYPPSTPIGAIIPASHLCEVTDSRVVVKNPPTLKVAETCNFGISSEINE